MLSTEEQLFRWKLNDDTRNNQVVSVVVNAQK